MAETDRAPFDLVEAEQELVGGFHTEYSGNALRHVFPLGRIREHLFDVGICATLFLGRVDGADLRWASPGTFFSALLPFVWFLIKTLRIIFLFFWIRATLPRMRTTS